MRKCIAIMIMTNAFFGGFSQSTNISTFFHKTEAKADYFFDHFAYRNALAVYMHTLRRDPANYRIRERIAMCYFKLHDPVSAELWYSSLAKEPDIHAGAMFEYAEALSMNGKYQESANWFRRYLAAKPEDKLARDKLEFLNNIGKYLVNDGRFLVFPAGFNSDHSEYGAHLFHDGVVFASSRDNDFLIKHKPADGVTADESLLNLYFARINSMGETDALVPFHAAKLKTYYHEGPMAFYDNYRKGAFTQSNLSDGKAVVDQNGKTHLRIYFAEVAHLGEFTHVAPFEYNNDEYSNAHPSFSPDGSVMYFSSTMPGGFGDSDLYYTVFENGRWSKPVNLGPGVNTREDESFPYIVNDSTLYFASNGHGTLGGLDIYVSYRRNGKFGRPVNLGSPVNSRFDDFSIVSDSTGRSGYLASNREGGKGFDDVYWYIAKFYFLAGQVRELSLAQDVIPDAVIRAFNSNGDLIDSARSDSSGYFTLDLPFDQDYFIRAEKEGFESLEDLAFSTRGKPFGVDSLMLPLWRQNLFVKGRTFSNETQSILPGATVVLQNLTDKSSDTLVVNESGEYRFLVRPRKKYRIEGSKEGHIPNGFNLDTKGILEGELLNDILLEEVYIEKEVVLFDYDEFEVLPEGAGKLNKIIRTLRRYPRATLNVGAHADSRGTKEYNLDLSRKRALATRDFLIARGVQPSRIQLSWFGEELILNTCSDGVECPEEEHSRNRRAELKVQKDPVN